MSRKLTIQEEVYCDICGKEIYGLNKPKRVGELYLNDGINRKYTFDLQIFNGFAGDSVEHICHDCLKEFLEKILLNLKPV